MKDGDTQKIVDYLDASTMLSTSSFQYAGSVLQFFPHPEGYVKATAATPTNTSYYYDYVGSPILVQFKNTNFEII